jgi:transposase
MNHSFFIGIDRSDQTIDFCQLDLNGEITQQQKIPSAPESLLSWVNDICNDLPAGQTLALCIEQPCQNLINFFSQFESLAIYLANPAVIKKYRESLSPSRAKDDRRDAQALARFVYERHRTLDPHTITDPLAHQIATLVEKRRQLVDIRTSISNKLTQALKDYFPQALQLVGRDLFAPLAIALLTKWPTLQAIQKARPGTITQFYFKQGSRRPEVIRKRIELIESAVPLCTDPGLLETYQLLVTALVDQLKQIQRSILKFDQLIARKTTQHQDAKLFTSLPGAGPCFAARLLAIFGNDRERYQDAASLQRHTGVAPLTKQSGKMHFVHRRYACNKFWRQTFVEWAAQTVMKSLWAKAYYHQQKEKGHRHQSILRSLAFKWQRILFRCWQNNDCYDEKRYLKALENRSSPLLETIAKIRKEYPKLSEQFS